MRREIKMPKVKAWVITAPGDIEIREFDKPAIADDCALLKVDAVGVCGSDKHLLNGIGNVKMPFIPGHEFVGTIEAVGKNASGSMTMVGMNSLKEGDQVVVAPASAVCGRCYFCVHMPQRPQLCSSRLVYGFMSLDKPPGLYGAFSEYVYLHPRSFLVRVQDDVVPERAVLAEPATIALRAVERGLAPGEPFAGHGFGPGKSVIVYGAGPIGLMVIAHLNNMGAGLIIAADLMQDRLDLAASLGANVLINSGKMDLDERLSYIRSLTNGVGVDLAIEAAGVPKAFQEALEAVRRGGILVEVGHYTDPGTTEIRPFTVCNKDVDIRGSWSTPPVLFKDSLDFLRRTNLPIEKVITHKVGFEKVPEAIEMLGKPGVGKVVVML
jgi:threonine dehydrogenase-like Zn-dependent dehydrogenase